MDDEGRREALVRRFGEQFGRVPEVLVCAPGRVNLIGEHTDYNGLPVLPMAVSRNVMIAAAGRADGRVALHNVSAVFAPREYDLQPEITPFAAGDWGNYHKAAAQGLVTALGAEALRGGDFLLDGNIPPGAGLSSSSAFVVASTLAFLALAGRAMGREEVAGLTAQAERYVGTLSGGMDQAVCLLARAGYAVRIDFDPLRAALVPVPSGCAFVVCHSLVRAEKSGAAKAAYNRRVLECKLACRVLQHALGIQLRHLGELRRLFPERPLLEFADMLGEILPDRAIGLREIAVLAGCSVEQLVEDTGGAVDSGEYPILRRARHVLQEAVRVDHAQQALAAGDWLVFGDLMDRSHASCRDDYEVSCHELEDLVATAKSAGAIGARLTGAGFGGCTVNLVEKDRVERFVTALEDGYYSGKRDAEVSERIFVFTPCDGAWVERGFLGPGR